jgi:hypothetical protein
MVWRWVVCVLSILCARGAEAQADDEAALLLADHAPTQTVEPRVWRTFIEEGLSTARLTDGGSQLGERLSLDGHVDDRIGSMRFVVSDRLDLEQYAHPEGRDDINTLKEAYLSWQPVPDALVDIGRVNLRYGVATGYNPTDFFRANAVRSIVSLDPSSLRENRQGTVVVQGQLLSDTGSLSVVLSPRLSAKTSTATFSPDWGATNASSRWLIAGTEKISDRFAPQLLLFGNEHEEPQVGMNLSGLIGNATTAYLEWSGGESPTLLGTLDPLLAQNSFRQRAALGATYTTHSKLSATLEYELNSAGLDASGLANIERGRSPLIAPFLLYSTNVQDLPINRAVFAGLTQTDARLQHLDLSAFARLDPIGHSHVIWGEARYHFDHLDIAMQLTSYGGAQRGIYGVQPSERIVTLLLRYFL